MVSWMTGSSGNLQNFGDCRFCSQISNFNSLNFDFLKLVFFLNSKSIVKHDPRKFEKNERIKKPSNSAKLTQLLLCVYILFPEA